MTFNNITSKLQMHAVLHIKYRKQTVTYVDKPHVIGLKNSKGYKYMADFLNGARDKGLPDS